MTSVRDQFGFEFLESGDGHHDLVHNPNLHDVAFAQGVAGPERQPDAVCSDFYFDTLGEIVGDRHRLGDCRHCFSPHEAHFAASLTSPKEQSSSYDNSVSSDGFIYAILDEHDNVKIGWSANPKQRIAALRLANPSRLRLVGMIAAIRPQETEIHALLKPWRIRGEWYRFFGPVRYFVETLPAVADEPDREFHPFVVGATLTTAAQVIDALGGTGVVAKVFGLSSTSVSNWKSRNRLPPTMRRAMADMLEQIGLTAPPSLWRQREAVG